MATVSDETTVIDAWINALIGKLETAPRRKLLRDLGQDLRRTQQARIAAQHNPDGSAYEPRKGKKPRARDKAGRVRRLAMFRKLRTARYLKVTVDAAGVSIGFDDRLSRIALIHQEGRRAPVVPGGPVVQYPARVLLGWPPEDRAEVLNHLLRYLTH